MPSGIAQKAKAVLKERCPDLALSAHATASNAIHDTNFVGTLHPWTNFEVDVEDSCATFDWTQLGQVLSHKPKGDPGAAYLSHEHIVCDNATSVRNRFQNNVGQVISAALRATGQSLAFGDYKASLGSPGLSQIVPDVVGIFTIQGSLRVVGEVKTPWVEDHDLELQSSTTTSFRHRLGQIAGYMQSAELKFGFLTTYNQTMFLKQDVTPTGWALYYSPVIFHSTESHPGKPSLRECFWYLTQAVIRDHQAANNTPRNQWVKMRN